MQDEPEIQSSSNSNNYLYVKSRRYSHIYVPEATMHSPNGSAVDKLLSLRQVHIAFDDNSKFKRPVCLSLGNVTGNSPAYCCVQ